MRTRVVLAFLFTVVSVGSAWAEDPVSFADANLKKAIEDRLWISDPTPTDMLGLTELVHPLGYSRENAITDLTGLQYAENLQVLNLRYHLVRSVSPLSGLTSLRHLTLNNNQLSDVSPLSGLANLEYADLHDNEISSISALSGLYHLQVLNLHDNSISNISALSGLTDLRTLLLHRNEISDISPLSTLTSLMCLDLRYNPLNQEACDIYIPQIVANNPGIDLEHAPCVHHRVVVSSTAGGSVTDPGEGQFTYGDGERIGMRAVADPCFAFVRWSGGYCTTENPMFLTVDQDYEIRANFTSVLDAICVENDAPYDPGPGDAGVSDPQENGTATHPFDSIQEAIDAAAEGASVLVCPGIYCENINLGGKSVQLVGIDPDDPNGVGYPIIAGAGEGPVVSFTRGEDPNCMLAGFVLTGGQGSRAGAILCSRSSPTIANCLIVGNHATDPDGAAIYCTDSNAVFSNCTVADNSGGAEGAGFHIVDSNVAVVNSIVWNNGSTAILLEGAGATSIDYSDVEGGWPGLGNLDVDPLFARPGYWIDPNDPDIVLEPLDHRAVWIAGDYHLQSQTGRWDPEMQAWLQDDVTSPCIDAGDPLCPMGQESSPNNNIINMGAYGGSVQASKSH